MAETAAAPAAAPSAPAAAPNANPGPDRAAPASPPNPGGETPAQQRQRIALADMPDDAEFVLRVNGADVAMPAAEARAKLQRAEASTRSWQESARQRKEAEAIMRAAAEKEAALIAKLDRPEELYEFLQSLGKSPDEITRALAQVAQQEAALTPEQRKLREYERQARAWEQERIAAQEAELQRTTEQHRAVYERAFSSAADLANVPKSDRVRMVVQSALVEAVGKAIQIGASLDMPQLVTIARQAYQEHASDYRAALTVEERRALITDEDMAWYAEQRKAKAKAPAVQGTPAPAPSRELPARDDAGRFRERGAAMDAGGRRVIGSIRDVLGSAWTSSR